MALRAEQIVKLEQIGEKNFPSRKSLAEDTISQKLDCTASTPDVSDQTKESYFKPMNSPDIAIDKEEPKKQTKTQFKPNACKEKEIKEARQQPDGQLADSIFIEEPKKPVVCYVMLTCYTY